MIITETVAKSILVQSRLPDTDYVINPYTGCTFGCAYCYAGFMGRFVGKPLECWGTYVCVKTNAVAVLKQQLSRMSHESRLGAVLLSSVTDPYQGVEARYKLTRRILETLAEDRYPGLVSVLTKSPLVLRDVEPLRRLEVAEVGLTVTTTEDALSRFLEVRAPSVSSRLRALKRLGEAGLNTYAFVGPLLPHFRYEPEKLGDLFRALAHARVESIYVEHLNMTKDVKKRLVPVLASASAEVQRVYDDVRNPEHQEALSDLVKQLLERYGLRLRMNGVMRHWSSS